MSNKAFSLVSGSCKLATKCSIFNAWLFDEDVLFELLVCCCVCAACAAIIIARTNRPIDWKLFSLSALNAFRMMSRTNIDRIRAEEFSSKHKRRSHDSFTTKEYKSVRRRRSLPSLLCCCRGKLFVLFSMQRSPLGKRRERNFLKRKERCVLCCVVSVVVSQTVAAFDTKNKEERKRAGFTESALTSPPLSCFCRRVFLLPRGVVYWCVRFVSRGGCAQSMLERGEEDSFPLHGRRRGCDFWSHSSSARQF